MKGLVSISILDELTYPLHQLAQDSNFSHGLCVKSSLVANQFDSDGLTRLVIEAFHDLTK